MASVLALHPATTPKNASRPCILCHACHHQTNILDILVHCSAFKQHKHTSSNYHHKNSIGFFAVFFRSPLTIMRPLPQIHVKCKQQLDYTQQTESPPRFHQGPLIALQLKTSATKRDREKGKKSRNVDNKSKITR